MTSSFIFLRVRGIGIGAHWTWLFVFFLVVYSLASAVLPSAYPDLSNTAYTVMAFVAAALFFVSILLHELGHAFTALREGLEIDGITLWLFGGVARISGTLPSPKAEFKIAIAGPVVTLVIAMVLGALGWAADLLDAPDQFTGVISYLAQINVLVLVFNLVPAFPLDGGRVLRAWLWHRQHSFTAATSSAARAGRLFGAGLIVVGILNLFGGGGSGGLWLVFLGWFLRQAALGETQLALLQATLGRHPIGSIMTPSPIVVPADMPISEFLTLYLRPRSHTAYPVVEGDRVVGLASLLQAGVVPEAERLTATVRDVMLPLSEVPTAQPDEPIVDRLDDIQVPPRRLLVMQDGRLVGVVSISDVMSTLERARLLAARQPVGVRGPGLAVWVVVGAIFLLAAGYLYHPPYGLIEPGLTASVTDNIQISGIETTPIDGDYRLVAVNVRQPNGLGLAWSLLEPDDEIVPIAQVIPPSVDPAQYQQAQLRVFDQSRMIAAAAAARAVGLQVGLRGSGARVIEVVEGSPAAEVLRPGDVIVAIDGQEIEVATQVSDILNSRREGSAFTLQVMRDGTPIQVKIETQRLPKAQGAGIGAYLTTDELAIDLPFEISFPEADIGGPSAGLVHALAIADLLDQENFAAGRRIVATGTIDLDGTVGPIGGVDAKAAAAKDAGADVFLVPQSQLREVDEEGLEIHGVTRFMHALELLVRTAA